MRGTEINRYIENYYFDETVQAYVKTTAESRSLVSPDYPGILVVTKRVEKHKIIPAEKLNKFLQEAKILHWAEGEPNEFVGYLFDVEFSKIQERQFKKKKEEQEQEKKENITQ